MVITNSGTILAFAEGRRNGPEDEGDIDIVLKVPPIKEKLLGAVNNSQDDGEKNRCRNQVPVLSSDINRIILLSCWNPRTRN